MIKNLSSVARNKSSLFLLVLALIVGGVGAQATGILNTESGGYLVCVNSKTKVVTHPGTSTCPKGSKKLVLGAQGVAGADGITGAAGITGKDGAAGKDGNTLWNGVKDPESTWGAPGDMFINSLTKTLFGPKDLTTGWPAGVIMVGATGATGPQGPGGSGPAGATGATGATGSNATLTCAQGGTCIVGNTGPGGGIVFYVNEDINMMRPWRYLEAAPAGWAGSDPDEATTIWCDYDVLINLATGQPVTGPFTSNLIGSGSFNSKLMMASCAGSAAHIANIHHGGGKFDWYLPSEDELTELYLKRSIVGGFALEAYYWSSTEDPDNSDKAMVMQFDGGTYVTLGKTNNSLRIRPIRAF